MQTSLASLAAPRQHGVTVDDVIAGEYATDMLGDDAVWACDAPDAFALFAFLRLKNLVRHAARPPP